MMGNPVSHFEILGRDAEALRRFYSEAFGWRIGPTGAGYTMVFPEAEDGINGGIGDAPPASDGHAIFYVAVADIDAALEQISQLGGRTVMPLRQLPGGPAIALFADPEGHVLGLAKTPIGQASTSRSS